MNAILTLSRRITCYCVVEDLMIYLCITIGSDNTYHYAYSTRETLLQEAFTSELLKNIVHSTYE